MATIALLCPDLLFGSKVEGSLRAAGHEVQSVLEPRAAAHAQVLVIDLTSDAEQRLEDLPELPTLAFYSHVERNVRELAEAAGVDRVVPRSRLAREGAQLVEAMLV